jgi:hypothetical protein
MFDERADDTVGPHLRANAAHIMALSQPSKDDAAFFEILFEYSNLR